MTDHPKWILVLAPLLLAIHLNYWMWDERGLILGLPVNLFYHVALSMTLYPVMRFVVRRGWPRYLSED